MQKVKRLCTIGYPYVHGDLGSSKTLAIYRMDFASLQPLVVETASVALCRASAALSE